MKNPLVSIIIPIYNNPLVSGSISEQILKQDLENFELILINDGSTDNTLHTIRELEKTDSRVVVIDKKNGGPSSARNAGLEIVRGTYTLFFDADDNILPNTLSTVVNAIQEMNSDLLVSGWQIDLEDRENYKQITPTRTSVDSLSLTTTVIRSIGIDGTLYNLWNKLFCTRIIQLYNLRFREDIRFGEDLVFGLNYLQHVSRLDIIPDVTYRYRVASKNSVFSKSSIIPEYRRINAYELEKFVGDKPDIMLDDLYNWVKWRWLLSYWIIVSGTNLPYGQKIQLIKENVSGKLVIASDARHIGYKKLLLERFASILQHLPFLALLTAKAVSVSKRLIIQLKLLK